MLKREWRSALVWIILASQSTAWGFQVSAPRTEPTTAAPEQKASDNADVRRRKEAFEIVWQTVKDNHYDPKFGGVDWDRVREEFAPRVALARSDRELHLLLQQMLNRLGQSHFTIIPPEDIPAEEPDDSSNEEPDDAAADAPKRRSRAEGWKLTEQLTHGIGIDLRLINGAAVITRVDPASSAERAGLRPGFVIRGIDGRSMRSIVQFLNRLAVYQPQIKHQLSSEIIAAFVNGQPGTFARLTYLDGLSRLRRAKLERLRLNGEMSVPIQAMPAQFIEFESKRLRGGVGYIRFNVFDVSVMDKFCAALRSMRDAPGVVIDLRGNRGGLLGMIYGMGGLLETVPISLGAMSTRGGRVEFRVLPQRHPYAGPLIILIDEASMSASEMFAAGLQEAGRAIIVGERSAGATLPSTIKTLPTGAVLQYVFADFETASGMRLEGHGVVPNLNVKLDRPSLLGGHDPQLEAALGEALRLSLVHTRYSMGLAPPPPPPRPAPTTAAAETALQVAGLPPRVEKSTEVKTPNSGPTAEQIIEKYQQAVGRREALEKLSTRISKGQMEGSFAGNHFSGTIEAIEKAPNKAVTLITIPSLGVVRRGFTGTYGYEQIPLFGFRELKGVELEILKLSVEFYWTLNLKRLYPSMTLKGKETIEGSETYVVEMTPDYGLPSTFYFDVKTGLLKRQDSIYFEDYKEVDGVMIPFTLRSPNTTVKLTEVKHNIPVDDSQFLEREDCFTK
ncbi:MAG TPA: S41 family peptidase [Pyrinomonadaceae bacterium]|jgi:carboxyl-terminal processing protease|nr:S41 family peptidase [Pyrinomonadaceae bacterium]